MRLSWRVTCLNHAHFWLLTVARRGSCGPTRKLILLRTQLLDLVTNEEVRAKIQQAIGPHEDVLTIVKRRKLQWYGHVSNSSGLAKTILQGTVKEGRRQGKQGKR